MITESFIYQNGFAVKLQLNFFLNNIPIDKLVTGNIKHKEC